MVSEKIGRGRLVKVIWRDASSPMTCRWWTQGEMRDWIAGEVIAETVGWIVHEDSVMLTLGSQVFGFDAVWDHLQRIPIATIIERRRLDDSIGPRSRRALDRTRRSREAD